MEIMRWDTILHFTLKHNIYIDIQNIRTGAIRSFCLSRTIDSFMHNIVYFPVGIMQAIVYFPRGSMHYVIIREMLFIMNSKICNKTHNNQQ